MSDFRIKLKKWCTEYMKFNITFASIAINVFSSQLLLRKSILFQPGIMETSAGQIEILLKRLSEAERRAKLLKLEVRCIRQEISSLQNEIGQNQQNFINPNIGNRVKTRRSLILIDPLPSTSTSETDGSVFVQSSSGIGGKYIGGSTSAEAGASKKIKASFSKDGDHVIVYTDGACENNGKANAKAGIGVWFGDNHPLNISKPVEGKATNNTAEIQACMEALRELRDQGIPEVKIITDSQFTINCMTKWIKNWKRNNWKTASGGPVKNKEDLQKLHEIIQVFSDVQWCHVAGHVGIKGNEEADKLAKDGARRYRHS